MNSFRPLRKTPTRAFLFLFLFGAQCGRSSSTPPESHVVPCSHIKLSASYLAEARPGSGPTYHFQLTNDTNHSIVLVRPVPSSAHWFTRDGEHWYWRASAGGGGSLVDAMSPNGRMFVYQATKPVDPAQLLRVAAHSQVEWEQGPRDNPALEFKPGCALCSHPADREFRAIFAYAYMPLPQDRSMGLLPCGIRSTPVEMPPIR